MTIEQMIKELREHMSPADSSYRSAMGVAKTYDEEGELSNKQQDYLKSVHQRIMTGIDGGYRPEGCLDDMKLIKKLLRSAYSDEFVDSLESWSELRGFLSESQYTALLEKIADFKRVR